MKHIWIFGDSYTDKKYNKANIERWPVLLDKVHNVKNFAETGTGPEYSLERLYQELETISADEAKEIFVIFFISDVTRYNFSFLKPDAQYMIKNIVDIDTSVDKNRILNNKKISFIKDFFSYYYFNQPEEMRLLEMLGAIKALSTRFKKVICASCNKSIPEYIPLSDGNFYLLTHACVDYIQQQHIFQKLSQWVDYE